MRPRTSAAKTSARSLLVVSSLALEYLRAYTRHEMLPEVVYVQRPWTTTPHQTSAVLWEAFRLHSHQPLRLADQAEIETLGSPSPLWLQSPQDRGSKPYTRIDESSNVFMPVENSTHLFGNPSTRVYGPTFFCCTSFGTSLGELLTSFLR